MKRFQWLAIFMVLLLAASVALRQHFQSRVMAQATYAMVARSQALSARLAGLELETAAAVAELSRLNEEFDKRVDHHQELMKLRDTVSRQRAVGKPGTASRTDGKGLWLQAAAQAWTDKLVRLKQEFSKSEESQIPEMEFVTDQDWLEVTKTDMQTEEDYLLALGKIREIGERKVYTLLNRALTKYMQVGGKTFPTDLGQLRPYLEDSLSQEILDRWGIFPRTAFPEFPARGEFVITQKYPGTAKYDRRFYFNEQSNGSYP